MSKDRGEVLFELPIGDSGKDGSVVVSQQAKQVYLLTFCSGADNRLISVCPSGPRGDRAWNGVCEALR